MIHRELMQKGFTPEVVNCFQNTTLVDDSQVLVFMFSIFEVVNCFQNTTLVDDSQVPTVQK